MRHSFLTLAVAALFAAAHASRTSAQSHEIPQLNSCIKEFYDPEMYKLLTFRNSCSESLTVVFIAKDASGINGKMDLRPGAKDSVGKPQGKQEPKIGSFALFVCPMNQVPLDENNQPVSKPGSSFHCQQKSN